MKSVVWSLLGFCTVVSAVAFTLLLAPTGGDGPARLVGTAGAGATAVSAAPGEGTIGGGGVLANLTSTGWACAIVALVFGAAAFAMGSYLTAKAAADSDDADLTLDFTPADA